VASRSRGQALVETALVIPVLLVMAFGLIALGRLTQTQMALSAVAREAARTGALANTASDARNVGEQRGLDVGDGYRLARQTLQVRVDVSRFARCGSVAAQASYDLDFSDLPMLGWARLTLRSTHAEPVDGYRSRLSDTC
jgi:hypothetical protein